MGGNLQVPSDRSLINARSLMVLHERLLMTVLLYVSKTVIWRGLGLRVCR